MKAFVVTASMVLGATALSPLTAFAAGANSFDGNWSEVIVGENKVCDVTVNMSFMVSNGHLSQTNSSGEVSPNGSARGTAYANGVSATWTGHFAGNRASGRFRRSDGCVGRWSAVRQ